MASTPSLTDTLAHRAVERAVADRRTELAEAMQRVVEATYELVERTGSLEPSMRQILAHTGLSTQAFYRLFRSKDELMLALLDDGRRRLVGHLEQRIGRADTPEAKLRSWVEGVMAQAADSRAAGRTRPFVVGEDRIAEMFPDEHQASVEQLVTLLLEPLTAFRGEPTDGTGASPGVRRDAEAVYRLTFATLRDHLLARQRPAPETVDHLVSFVLHGVKGGS
ncbi:MAG TPA: TetR/AcrR family transcriptional regulator [Acidimicrobiales bacterium]|nr:TetR/AcrR family transcriptional regulator [Acidimicrobiales bacterium]